MLPETVTIFSLRNGRELHLDVPDWYFQSSGDYSIRTPHSTHVIYNKSKRSHRPFTKDFLVKHYLSSSMTDTAEQMDINHLSIKPFGEEESVFEVVVTEEVIEHYCEDYPPLTIVESE